MIRKVGDFYIDERENERLLGVDTANLQNCIDKYKSDKFDGIFGYTDFGFTSDNLDFMEHFQKAKKIWFWDVNIKNVEGLYKLKELKFFGIHGKRSGVDFSQLPNLQTISTDWNAKDVEIDSCVHVENFYLWHHKPKEKSFEKYLFPCCKNEFQINWSNITDLTSLKGLAGIKRFEMHRCRNLVSLRGLENYQDTLETVIVTTCSKLVEYEFLKEFKAMKLAIIDGNRIVG